MHISVSLYAAFRVIGRLSLSLSLSVYAYMYAYVCMHV